MSDNALRMQYPTRLRDLRRGDVVSTDKGSTSVTCTHFSDDNARMQVCFAGARGGINESPDFKVTVIGVTTAVLDEMGSTLFHQATYPGSAPWGLQPEFTKKDFRLKAWKLRRDHLLDAADLDSDKRKALDKLIRRAIGYGPVKLSIRNHPEITSEYRTADDMDMIVKNVSEALIAEGWEPRG